MRYIQKVTWRVGGISPVEYDGNVIKGQNPHEAKVSYLPDECFLMIEFCCLYPVVSSHTSLISFLSFFTIIIILVWSHQIISGDLLNDLNEIDVAQVGGAVVGMDGYIMGVKQVPQTKSDGTSNDGVDTTGLDNGDEAVRLFKDKIRLLERAAKAGQLDNVDGQGGGIWLNGLSATKSTTEGSSRSSAPHDESTVPSPPAINNNIVLPPPIEGYEERIEALRRSNAEQGIVDPMEESETDNEASSTTETSETKLVINTDQDIAPTQPPPLNVDLGIPLVQSSSKSQLDSATDDILTAAGMDREDPMRMLSTRRGYQMKRLENIEAGVTKKIADHKDRIEELQRIVTKSTTLTSAGRR